MVPLVFVAHEFNTSTQEAMAGYPDIQAEYR